MTIAVDMLGWIGKNSEESTLWSFRQETAAVREISSFPGTRPRMNYPNLSDQP